MSTPAPRTMTLDEFTPHCGKTFRADCSPAEVSLDLVEAYPLRDAGLSNRPPFMLIFRSSPEAMLLEGSYAMRCDNFGPDLVYIVPIQSAAKDKPGHYYQAVFN